MKNMNFYIPGILLILTGIMIVAVPEILIAFIAASAIIAGVSVLYVGHLIRKFEIKSGNFENNFYDDGLYNLRFEKGLFFRKSNHRF